MRPVLEAARNAGIPIRIGVNAGSLDEDLAARNDLTLPEKLAESARVMLSFVRVKVFMIWWCLQKRTMFLPRWKLIDYFQKLYQRFLFILVSRKQALVSRFNKICKRTWHLARARYRRYPAYLSDRRSRRGSSCVLDASFGIGLASSRSRIGSCPTCGRCQLI